MKRSRINDDTNPAKSLSPTEKTVACLCRASICIVIWINAELGAAVQEEQGIYDAMGGIHLNQTLEVC